jgi:mRNA deadenylase 3'-5' endonuclease subunit Ccr4
VLVVSWNVLADAYVRASYYPRTPRELLGPGARTEAIVSTLDAIGADVVCLQEVEPALVAALIGWRVHYGQKPGKPEGCAILMRDALRADTLALPDAQVAVLARTHVAGVATTHLRWDPPGTPRASRQAVRESEALLASLDLAIPWIVCGDLNVEPGDEVCVMFAEAGFRDACAGRLVPTANPNGRAKRIDHMFVRGALDATAVEVLEVTDKTPLPSSAMPSDHVPIGARFRAPEVPA